MKAMIMSDLIIMRRNLGQLFVTCAIITIVITLAMNNTLGVIGGCFGTMIPLLYLFSIAAYDELNGWQTYRLTLPTSRTGIVIGRYLSVLIVTLVSALAGIAVAVAVGAAVQFAGPAAVNVGDSFNYTSPNGAFLSTLALNANPPEMLALSAVAGASMALLLSAITLPLVAKVGLTKGARYVPVVTVALFLIAFAAFGEGGPLSPYVPDPLNWIFSGGPETLVMFAAIGVVSLALYGISMLIAVKLYRTREL